jgi:predicted nucleic acid-binding protein
MAEAFVLHSSVTAAWLLPEAQSPEADRVYARLRASVVDAHAPELWLWECGNLIAEARRQGRLSADDGLLVWSVLDAVRTRVELATFEPAQARACLVLAFDAGLTLHDAAYLWLARSLKLPLLTHDERLAEAAGRCSVSVITAKDF